MTGIPFPEDDYLVLIGKFAYAISYLEQMLIGDVGHLPGLPSSLSVEVLSGKTAGQIANAVDEDLPEVSNPGVVTYLETCAAALREMSAIRNHLFHARPATADGGVQRLYRWRSIPSGTDAFLITDEWIEDGIRQVGEALSRVFSVRPPLPH